MSTRPGHQSWWHFNKQINQSIGVQLPFPDMNYRISARCYFCLWTPGFIEAPWSRFLLLTWEPRRCSQSYCWGVPSTTRLSTFSVGGAAGEFSALPSEAEAPKGKWKSDGTKLSFESKHARQSGAQLCWRTLPAECWAVGAGTAATSILNPTESFWEPVGSADA